MFDDSFVSAVCKCLLRLNETKTDLRPILPNALHVDFFPYLMNSSEKTKNPKECAGFVIHFLSYFGTNNPKGLKRGQKKREFAKKCFSGN